MIFVLATGNAGKVKEFKLLLEKLPVELKTMSDYPGMPIPIEDKLTFKENALIKARVVCEYSNQPSIADDSGLEVDVLDGAPGVFSARYAGENATSKENIEKLLKELAGNKKRDAKFKCSIAVKYPSGEEFVVEDEVKGKILFSESGDGGFGYDSVFMPNEYNVSFANMPMDEKNKISHRGKALKKLVSVLASRHGLIENLD